MIARALLLCIALLMAIAAPAMAQRIKVVASFSILGDMAERVGGDRIELRTLAGPDSDAHMFEPTAADARAVAQAKLLLVNGLAFDTWAGRLAKASGSSAQIVVASHGVKALNRGTSDPHAWQDVRNALIYVANIADGLAAADPLNAEAYRTNATAYADELRRLDADIRAQLAVIPIARRRVISTHDAFAYFAAAYEVRFLAPLGTSTEEQASAKGVARLIAQIKREKVTAVFVENISDPRLIEQIARETGVKIGGKLYSDALSTKAGPAPTYVAMMRHNAKLLTAAMPQGH